MCSIFGGTKFNEISVSIYNAAKDRGRDYTGLCQIGEFWIANHRATPTNEEELPVGNQPFGRGFKIVHNGTVANDKELGVVDGEIDSKAFEYVLDVKDVHSIKESLEKVIGSYALAILTKETIFLACNYKPIFYSHYLGEIYFSSLSHHLPGHPIRLQPYSVLNLLTGENVEIRRFQPDRALIICSGGLDSTAVTGYAKKKHDEIKLLHFDYGCRATEREKEAVKNIACHLGCDYDILNLDYTRFKGESTLFRNDKITTGKSGVEYAIDWVYARNLVMLSVATAYAEANRYGWIYLGTNLEESGAYPDNEEQFIRDFNNLLYGAVQNGYKIEICTPLGGLMKREIVEFGIRHKSPIELSWSCYNNEEEHCGECAPCFMRKLAFKRAGVIDTTKYLK